MKIIDRKASFGTIITLVILVTAIWNYFGLLGKIPQNNELVDVELFPPIEPYKCVETNELLYGGIRTRICIKPLENDVWISKSIANTGAFEGSKVSVVLKAVSMYPTAVFLDIGSNLGMYTVMVAAAGREVVAVDAMMVNLAYIHQSLQLNKTTKFVKLLNNPVSDKRETLFPILEDLSNEGGTRLIPKHLMTGELKAVGPPLHSTTLLDLLNFINKEVVIIKMDVEGFECKVLHQYLLNDHPPCYIPYISMEWVHIRNNLGSNCPDLPGLVDALYSNNYQPYSLPWGDEDHHLPNNLDRIDRADVINTGLLDILWAHKNAPALFWKI